MNQEVAIRTRLFVVLATLVVAALTASWAQAHTSAASPCSSGTVTKTGSYRLSLEIGPRQEMYMASEVQSRHLKTGQVMLGGEMAMTDKPPAGTKIYDLQVHVCTKSGAVVTALKPTIVVRDPKSKTTNVPVAMMAGVAEGLRDYHYGNDVALTPGAPITVTVTIEGRHTVFRTTVPKKS